MANVRNSQMYGDVSYPPKQDARAEFDLEDRDPLTINPHLMVRFDDLFAEPEGIKSPDCIWTCTYKTFRGTKWCCYNFITAICFVPTAFLWGCCFAYTPFVHIWCLTPWSKCLKMNFHFFKFLVSLIIDSVLSPLFYTCGLVYSRFRISVFHENQPIIPADTAMHRV